MLLPTGTSKSDCLTNLNNILSIDNDSSNASTITKLTQDSFFSNPDYNKVYKNFDNKELFDAWIYEGNEEDKIVGYKKFQSYPYPTVQFKIGDYIHWNYNQNELSTWIITSLDTQYLYNVCGRILLCNNTLKWKDEKDNIICYPCVIKDALTYTNLKWGNSGLVENGGDIIIIVQRNKETSLLNINDRFVFSGVSFKIKQKFNELNPNYLELYMTKVPELDGDNLIDNIAINKKSIPVVLKNDIVILPQIEEISQGDTINFSVYNYIDKIQQTDTFNVEISDVPNENYELNIINGNNFSIKNILVYTFNQMTIKVIDNITQETKILKIWLGGNW